MGLAVRERAPALLVVLLLVLGTEAGALSESCHLPKVVGRCRAAFQRWWYNATSQTCQKFIFGGCRGNQNNFLTEQECHQACALDGEEEATAAPEEPGEETVMPVTTKDVSKSGRRLEPEDNRVGFREFCVVRQAVGPCRASFPRWYFDIETRTCKMFIYGGCGGNKNNYVFEDHCLSQCTGTGEITEEHLEPDTLSHHFADSLIHSTRAVVLTVLLAIMAAVLLGSLVVFFVKMCRRDQGVTLGTVWNSLDDKEYLMNNAYTL